MKSLLLCGFFGFFLLGRCYGSTETATSEYYNKDLRITEDVNYTNVVGEFLDVGVAALDKFMKHFNDTSIVETLPDDSIEFENTPSDYTAHGTTRSNSSLFNKSLFSDLYKTLYDVARLTVEPEMENVIANRLIQQIRNAVESATELVGNKQCRSDLQLYFRELSRGQSWAMKMFDSSAKLPIGALMGNMFEMGNFDECVEIEGVKSIGGEFRGQHCVVGLIPSQRLLEDLMPRVLKIEVKVENKNGSTSPPNPFVALEWSVCVPSTCRPGDVEKFLQHLRPDVLGDFNIKLNRESCTTAIQQNFRPIDWFTVGVLSLFGFVVVLSTVYDMMKSSAPAHHVLLVAFSLDTNGRSLLSSSKAHTQLFCVHGIRVLSMLWVLYGHRYYYAATASSVNAALLLDYASDWGYTIFVNSATFAVDTFLLVSGFLLCYLLLEELDSGAPYRILHINIYRYIRLTPAYAIMILFTATLFYYTGNGPQWETVVGQEKLMCEENWWIDLMYLHNYLRSDDICISPSWYLAIDTQLFWMSPLLLYPLWRWPKYGKYLLAFLFVCGTITSFLTVYITQFSQSALPLAIDVDYYFRNFYLPTHMRFTPWLIGIGLGYLLHHTRHTTVHLSKISVTLAWFTSAVLMFLPMYAWHYIQQPDYKYDVILESLNMALARPGWALGVAWIIFACCKGFGGVVNTFLSWRFFQVLSRLTYCVYLVHHSFYIWVSGSARVPKYISDSSFLVEQYGVVVVSFAAALVLSLVFEAPFIVVGKYVREQYTRNYINAERNHRQDINSELNDAEKTKTV